MDDVNILKNLHGNLLYTTFRKGIIQGSFMIRFFENHNVRSECVLGSV